MRDRQEIVKDTRGRAGTVVEENQRHSRLLNKTPRRSKRSNRRRHHRTKQENDESGDHKLSYLGQRNGWRHGRGRDIKRYEERGERRGVMTSVWVLLKGKKEA